MGVGMPADLWLHEFGSQIWAAFGHSPYHVGSSLKNKQWRDVDVRLILPDDEYESMGLGDPKYPHHNEKWVSLVLAYSALGKAMTGLPIDFQIQQQTDANEQFSQRDGHTRSALGVVPLRMKKYEKQDESNEKSEAMARILSTLFATEVGQVSRCRKCGCPVVHMEHLSLEEAQALEAEVRALLNIPATLPNEV